MKQNSKQAFTLIELLVVISIIAILSAILFPVFARAREQARKAACQSNLKQIGIAIMMYTQDYDESFPYAAMSGATAGASNRWYDVSILMLKASNKYGFVPQRGRLYVTVALMVTRMAVTPTTSVVPPSTKILIQEPVQRVTATALG